MIVNCSRNNSVLTVCPEGRLDTVTTPVFESELKKYIDDDVKELVLDFEKLEYISSAGLRVLLSVQKKMKDQGSLIVRHVNEEVMEVFEMTGFIDILTVEK